MKTADTIRRKTQLACLLLVIIVFSGTQCDITNSRVKTPGLYIPNPDGVTVDRKGRMMITQYGISWLFDTVYDYGQFVNGDYWIEGPVTIVGLNPVSMEFLGRTMNGSMINPSPEQGGRQGYDSTCPFLTYDASLNVALDVSSSNPLVIPNGTSLVSTVSAPDAGVTPQLRCAAVLTVIDGPPPEGSFRPPYSGTDKSFTYNYSSAAPNLRLLKKLAPVAETPALAEVERYFERPWIDHISGWTSRMIHPSENMPDYGREMSAEAGIGALMLHLDFTDEQKQTLLIRYLQLGIDFYRNLQLGDPEWPGEGAHGSGRKWPIIFTGLMLGDAGMQSIGQRSGEYLYSEGYGPGNPPPDFILFGEEGQTFYVTQEDVNRTNDPDSWNPDPRSDEFIPYTTDNIGLAEWGIHHTVDPWQDNNSWSTIYRQCCGGIAWQGFLLAARIMNGDCGTIALWNHDAIFDYEDRYMAVTAETGDTPAWRYSSGAFISEIWASNPGWRSWGTFPENMWDTYRADY